MKRWLRIPTLLLAILLPVILGGSIGSIMSMNIAMSPSPMQGTLTVPPSKIHDPQRPTAVVVLGDTISEITDVLGPYALFAETERYNVYTVAATREVRALSGGIDVMPDFAFNEIDHLLPAGPEIIIVPAITEIAANQPVLTWLRSHASTPNNPGSLLFSWCSGAEVLAASGVLDGKAATAFWADLAALEDAYPQVRWQRGVRYVDETTVLTTAGLTSGIDATLYLLAKRHGQELVNQIADKIQYQVQYLNDPTMAQYTPALADSVYILNAAFYWPKQKLGVWLYDGIDELNLAAILDIYTASWTHEAISFAAQDFVRSKHGIHIIPRWKGDAVPALDALILSRDVPSADLDSLNQAYAGLITILPQSSGFIVKDVLELYAQTVNRPSAQFAAKRLEYRQAMPVDSGFVPYRTLAWIGGLGALGAWLRWWIARRFPWAAKPSQRG